MTDPFRLVGDIDLDTAPAIGAELLNYVAATEGDVVVVDCSEMTFIDSSGVKALVAVAGTLRNRERRLRMVDVSPGCRTVLRVTGIDEIVDVDSAHDEAGADPGS